MDVHQRVGMLAGQAERIVRRYVGREVTLRDPILIAVRERNLVARCAVTDWDSVEWVAFKRNEGDDARGFTDWASLAFLSTLVDAVEVAPRFYGGDVQERLFVMEDLGGSRSLAEDRPWTPGWTCREALISTALRLRRASVGVTALKPLAELGGGLVKALRVHWPDLGDGALRWPGVVGAP